MVAPDHIDAPSYRQENALRTTTNRRVGVFILLLFIIASAFGTIHKDMDRGFDELAHISYVAYLQHSGDAWPDFAKLPMLDPSSFRFTSQTNYLNHPSPYYWLMARLGPNLEGHPEAVLFHRLLNVALDAIGLAALMAIGLLARLPLPTFCAYFVPIACIPVLTLLAGSVSNDNAAFVGGAIATLGACQLLVSGSRAWLLTALGGVIVASWAKFTALLLAGGLVGGVLLWLLWRGRLPSRWIAPIAIAALLACAPYIAFTIQYGSPTPMTAGELTKVTTEAADFGWARAERLGPLAYATHFVGEFILEWIPPWKRLNVVYYALVIPIAAAFCAYAGAMVAMRRVISGKAAPLDVVTAAGALAFAGTLMIHVVFSYRLHVEFGWLSSAYPRYYLPLAALFPLAGLALLGEIRRPSARAALLVFLIAGPVVFRLLLEPLG
ncbi:MAG TPA: hypothetical protein VGM09_16595 [Bradyrhizobium sp.]|jgi:hypothetical protein